MNAPSPYRPDGCTLEEPLKVVARHLANSISQHAPDWIVVSERKGRALLRALIDESPDLNFSWPWHRIISSSVLAGLPESQLAGKRLLIFDDTLRTGQSINKLIQNLATKLKSPADHIALCAIGSHLDANPIIASLQARKIKVNSYFRSLCTDDFHILRKSLVETVRHLGSLLLDTEHAELRFGVTSASFREVLDALGRNAKTVVFESGRDTKNITVYYGDQRQLSKENFPGCEFTDIVKKARVIRVSENEYTIIPFCLPSVPACNFQWPHQWQVDIFGGSQPETEINRFYQVGLLASLEILGWAVKDLVTSLGGKVKFKFPVNRGHARSHSYNYDHLLPIYPNLDIELLTNRVTSCTRANEKVGMKLGVRKKLADARCGPWNENNYSFTQMDRDGLRLIQSIADELGWRASERLIIQRCSEDTQVSVDRLQLPGLRAKEVFTLGSVLKIKDSEVSALFDILIDNGMLVTKIEVQKSHGENRCVRTFRPDGEVISGLLREYTRKKGLPYELFIR